MSTPIVPADTPRTNAQEVWAMPQGAEFVQPMVLGDFARELERENAKLRAALTTIWYGEYDNAHDCIAAAKVAAAALK